jgi:predicted dehydrogenase
MEKAKEMAEKYGASLFFDDLDALAACGEIDAIYVASPNFLHKKQSIQMMKGKKHVFCEKPAGANLRELDEMIQCAKDNGVVFMEGLRVVFTPNFKRIQESLNKLGTLRRAYLPYNQYSSRYDKFKNGIIENAFRPEMCNGAVMDLGIYPGSFMSELFGAGKVAGATAIFLNNGFDGTGTALVNYGGMMAEIVYSKISTSRNL